ncbi:zinc-binding dehydrogenase [Erythrobacter sp. HL-111]|uniref:alcohol dehydrogenase catalytic domain-containing protein n=1 Tax=Erythrobacter sp. HL-111 TaxID=1798193 RepID=UPI0006DB02F9|nr:zinc-binding dehydrogenase [Erythrobacter sp. HL-111]KPP96288.1 MAG: aryl-alcohol dehydrogenase [Erythrobacteraceae bacterium HL-111]SDR74697.1 aryl-alcohol dehydrogenase [Erythrobacter sp. HL-111]
MPRRVRAAVSPGGGAPPGIEELLLDDPLPDEVVLRVEAAGVCHTDLGVGAWSREPRVLGHEGAGVVVATGAAVKRLRPGDRVLATFGWCGTCPNCTRGRPAYCFDGIALNLEGARSRPPLTRPDGEAVRGAFFQQSCFATHALATERNCVKLPDWLDAAVAAPFGCGIQTGAGAVFHQLGALPGRPLLVIGAGAVGAAAIMAGRITGCDPVIVVEPVAARRELALSLGASHAFDGSDADWAEQIVDLTGGGATAALDTAGKQATFEAALRSLHSGGTLGVLTLPGAFEEPVPHPGGIDFLTKRIVGVIEGDSVPETFLPRLFAHHAAGDLPIDRLIRTYPFAAIASAFADAHDGAVIKPVLTFEEEHDD